MKQKILLLIFLSTFSSVKAHELYKGQDLIVTRIYGHNVASWMKQYPKCNFALMVGNRAMVNVLHEKSKDCPVEKKGN